MRFPGFIGPSYNLPRSANVDAQQCINLYLEKNEGGRGKEGELAALFPTPGLTTLLTLAGGAVRGEWTASDGEVFAVGGNKFYSISPSWVATELGTLNTSVGKVSISDNGTHVVIVDGSDTLYVWNISTVTFSTKTSADNYNGADIVIYQDGYFIFNWPGTNKFYISGLNAVTFDPLDFASSEGSPDAIVGHISNHRDLWMFNEGSTEVFFNSGNAAFPFERISGAFIEIGCAAKFSIAKLGNSVYWIGKDEHGYGIVYMATGYAPQRISTHAVEQAIQGYANFSDAVAYCYQQDGHGFYVLNFPLANTTWVFDAATGVWHERAYLNDGAQERHRGQCHCFAFGKHLVGDYATGKIYNMANDIYSDDGSAIMRRRRAPHVSSDSNRVRHSKFQLDIETGVGIDGSGQGSDPQVMLRFSDDGGHQWSNEKWASFGAIGARRKRAIWRRLGMSRDRVYEVTITDPVKTVFIGADIEIERMAS